MTKEIERIRAALEADTSQDVAMILMREEMVAVLSHIDAQQAEIARLTAEVTRPESSEMTMMRTLAQSRGEEIERLREDADNAADTAVIALRKAWQLGQTYWQQADSEYTSHHAKADVTQQKFKTLCDETSAAMKGEIP